MPFDAGEENETSPPRTTVLNQVWTVAHGFGDDNRAIDRFAARLGDYEARLSTYFGT